ncbi:WYL domain-containing protein [Citrobacter sp. Igbk 17]|uniref:WYL domain-containing protein n=1 Tax=Citrobacter sp. Igbk 17 TaxID=2963957 RepID=UPI00230342DB|nr:WYL domain-containing protein [Citrobacter sp. Igbk 17]MDA8499079.1 WYL domain-containing protein [Citrobacter sp. Igbk 17]
MSEQSLNKAILERMKFIEMTLRFRGSVSRSDLSKKFDISLPAATRDFRKYKDFCPENTIFNEVEKRYEINESEFVPKFAISFNEAMGFIRNSLNSKIIGFSEYDSIQSPPRLCEPDLDILLKITRAILGMRIVNAEYFSVENGFSKKKLAPHSLIDNGLRWHIRAYDYDKGRFADFVLTRFKNVEETNEKVSASKSRSYDNQWNRIVRLELVPHPNKNNVNCPETLEYDFNMKDEMKVVEVRAAVAGYWLRRWNIDCSNDHSLQGKEYQLWLKNSAALYDVSNAFLAPGYKNQ